MRRFQGSVACQKDASPGPSRGEKRIIQGAKMKTSDTLEKTAEVGGRWLLDKKVRKQAFFRIQVRKKCKAGKGKSRKRLRAWGKKIELIRRTPEPPGGSGGGEGREGYLLTPTRV